MTLGRTRTVSLFGVSGALITVEGDIAPGMPGIAIVGMGDTAVAQARDRVRAAVLNSGFGWPGTRITVSLAPAGLHKRGAAFDTAIAAALLMAAGELPASGVGDLVMIGELGLDGGIRPVQGVLPSLLAAHAAGITRAMVPVGNLAEASLARGMQIVGVATLRDMVAHLRGLPGYVVTQAPEAAPAVAPCPDMADVLGQPEARFALELAAAGGHHIAMIGPPGSGKTMLAARLPGLLPPLTEQEALEVTAIHSVAGVLDSHTPLIGWAPFVDPHHSASQVAMIGGGSGDIRPGAISLAHRGVLFLDEAAEFKATVLDSLRQPMESGSVLITRARQVARFPSRFQLVLAANPCPCAAARDTDCRCAPSARRRYLARISGPLLDRIDIRVDVPPADLTALVGDGPPAESSAVIADRVREARARASRRWARFGYGCNAQATSTQVRAWWKEHVGRPPLLERAVRVGRLTARGYDRVLRLALTAADVARRDIPADIDIARALALRAGEAIA